MHTADDAQQSSTHGQVEMSSLLATVGRRLISSRVNLQLETASPSQRHARHAACFMSTPFSLGAALVAPAPGAVHALQSDTPGPTGQHDLVRSYFRGIRQDVMKGRSHSSMTSWGRAVNQSRPMQSSSSAIDRLIASPVAVAWFILFSMYICMPGRQHPTFAMSASDENLQHTLP